jgi:hypothetical protein
VTVLAHSGGQARVGDQMSLVDLLDRLLGTGVVLSGDVVISLAGIDLVEIQLAAVIRSVTAEFEERS